MVQQVTSSKYYSGAISPLQSKNSATGENVQHAKKAPYEKGSLLPYNLANVVPIVTKLSTPKDEKMYSELVNAIKHSNYDTSAQDGVSVAKKMDALLKSGKLLSSASNDGSTTLQNLYDILNSPRCHNLDNLKIIAQTIDVLYNPAVITQNFGDIPDIVKSKILETGGADIPANILVNPSLMDVDGSGTCVAASVEFHMANKHPAEFARWVSGLTSQNMEVEQKVRLEALSKNILDAVTFLDIFEVKQKDFNFEYTTLSLKPDDGAYIRAQVQNNYWDRGERTIVDVLMQSTLMQLGSQESYDSLSDFRAGKFSSNPQGLVETEKTFIESIVENNEKLSIRYQKVDDNQNLIGWECDFDKIQKHIIDTLNIGEDVIIGYVLTNETSGKTKNPSYVNTSDNAPNKIINGHEITIVGYKTDKNGKVTFICNDTDDDKSQLIEYTADFLIPKIHHAAYPVSIVEDDLALIEAQQAAA